MPVIHRVGFKASEPATKTDTGDKRADLESMMRYYEKRFQDGGDVLYNFCFELTHRAWEKLGHEKGKSKAVCEIEQNAGSCEGASRVLSQDGSTCRKPPESLSYVLLRMLDDGQPRGIDGIIFASGHDAGQVNAELFKLELGGRVKKLPGGRYQRK